MKHETISTMPQALKRARAGGEAISKASLYKYSNYASERLEALSRGFRTVKAYKHHLYLESCREFEKLLGITPKKDQK